MNRFWQLFKINLLMVYRDKSGLFWTLAVPILLYIALAVLPIPKIAGQAVLYKNFALPGVIAYLTMQSGIYSLAYWMVELRSRGVIKRFLVTPIKANELILSVIAARLTVILIQSIFITAIGVVFFNATFVYNIFSSFLLLLLGGSIFLLIGLLISYFSPSYQTAAPITAAIGMPFAFLGNLFFPIDILPKAFQIIAKILPVTYLADGLRQAYLFKFDLWAISKNLFTLVVWLVIMLVATTSIFKLRE